MPKKYLFRRVRKGSNPAHILILLILVVSVLLLRQAQGRGEVQPMFLPTPTATRMVNSYILEARTHFDAGSFDKSITAFQQALQVDPENAALYSELARVLTYSSEMTTSDDDRAQRLQEAVQNAKKATELSEDSSTAWAMLAFATDWYATYVRDTLLDGKQGESLLGDAEQYITNAMVHDETNTQAQIYYAEIMIDRYRFEPAQSALQQVLQKAPDMWEAHRVNGLYLENQARYLDAIKEYEKAVELSPNMTFLYIKLGRSYRSMGMSVAAQYWRNPDENPFFNDALSYFTKAANLNEQLGIQDPNPYLGIGYTYAQMGQFFAASRNMVRALSFDPTSPTTYGEMGIVARQGSNFELSLDAFQCAVDGCNYEVSCRVRSCDPETDKPIEVQALPLNANTVKYYFTYSSLLAGLYLPGDPLRENYCRDSLRIMDKVLAVPDFANEPVIVSILDESAAICANYGFTRSGRSAPTVSPTVTPTPPGS